MRKLYAFLLPALFLLLPALSHAQTTATIKWDFGTAASTVTEAPAITSTVPSGLAVPTVSQHNNNGTTQMVTTSSVSGPIPPFSGSANAGAAARTGAFSDLTGGSAYFEFTLTPGAAQSITVTEIDFGSRSTGTGPVSYNIRTSLDAFATPITGSMLANSTWAMMTNAANLAGATGQAITIRIYGYGGTGSPAAGTANWRIDDIAVTVSVSGSAGPQPTVNISGSPTAFSTFIGTASASQSVSISGTNLTNDITVTAPAGFEISLDNSTFAPTQTLTASSGTVAATPVFARISASTPLGPVSGNLTASSSGATNATVLLSGTVNATVVSPTGLTATAASAHAINLTATANANGDNILIAYNTTATFGTPSGTLTAGASISGGGTVIYNGPAAGLPFQQTGLKASTKYFYTAWSVDGSNSYSTAISANATTDNPAAALIKINQVYGGGGNSGAQYNNDFIELFSDADTAVDLTGWSVQYASAKGTSWQVTPLSGTIAPHSFFLIQEGAGASSPQALPTPDLIPPTLIAMAAASGKVVLVHSTVAQTGNNPSSDPVVDKVGYGDTDGFEGTAPAGTLSNTTSAVRKVDGADTDDNLGDFQVLTPPNPRNSTYTITPPTLSTITPPNGRTDVPVNYQPFATFSKLIVKGTGNITLTADGGSTTTIDVNDASIVISGNKLTITAPLAGNTTYHVAIDAGTVKDVYGNSFAGLSSASWSFTTFNTTASIVPDYTNDFENCNGVGLLPGGFIQYSVIGAQVWDCTTFGRDPAAPAGTVAHGAAVQINGFANNVNNVNQDWLISPRFNLTTTPGQYALLDFWSRSAFTGSQLQLKISSNYSGTGDPNLADWTDLNGRFPSSGSNVWALSDSINLTAFNHDNVYIAFVYTSTTDDGARWTLDDIKVYFSTTPPPPTLTISSNSAEFGYAAVGTTVDKKITVLGNDLTTDIKVVVANGANFQVSTDSVNFSNSIVIGKDTANNKTEPVFIRFTPTVANTQSFDSLKVYIGADATPDTSITVNVKGNSISPASTLNIVNWNMEWFATGEAGFGPPDKDLQKANAKTVLQNLKADLFVLEEVVNVDA
ncbi:MAG: Ig-like domain-containing protein, partial [Bacteroidetes bacterium]|nr:Ig-like domain-containing protein [Bacteroidota bacterium]